MDGSSDDTLDDRNKSNRQLRSHNKNSYGMFKKRPFLPPGVCKNTPKFKYVPCFRDETEDKIENTRQLRFRSTIQKRPFLPVGKSATSFNVNYKKQTPLWERALKKRKNDLQNKLTQVVKSKSLNKVYSTQLMFTKPNNKLTKKPSSDSVDLKEKNSIPKQKPPPKSSNKYISLARSKLIKSPKIDNIKNCAVSTPFTQLGMLDIKQIGNFSIAANKINQNVKKNKTPTITVTKSEKDDIKKNIYVKCAEKQDIKGNIENSQYFNDSIHENKTPGQLRYSLRERKSTPNYSDLYRGPKISTGVTN